MKKYALLYDVHAPYHDEQAYEVCMDNIKKQRPKVSGIWLCGDFVDFYDISFWKSDPERLEFKEEVDICKQMLIDLKRRFPRVPVGLLEGNHEARLYRYCRDKMPQLLYRNSIEDVLDLRVRQIRYVSNIARMCNGKEPLKLGKLYVLHGHEKKVSYGAINLAKLYYDKCRVNVIAGHHHRSDYRLFKKLDGSHEAVWCVGTLGQLSEPYQPINEWNHGWAFVDVFDDGDFNVHNKIFINGKVFNGQ